MSWTVYPRLWLRLLRMSYRHAPWGTAGALALWLLGVVTLPATALALRAAVDAGTRAAGGDGGTRVAVLAAIGVAVAYAANVAVEWMAFGHTVHLIDMTNGEPTPFGSVEIRAKEAAQAAEILGVKRTLLGLKNREVVHNLERALLTACRKGGMARSSGLPFAKC